MRAARAHAGAKKSQGPCGRNEKGYIENVNTARVPVGVGLVDCDDVTNFGQCLKPRLKRTPQTLAVVGHGRRYSNLLHMTVK